MELSSIFTAPQKAELKLPFFVYMYINMYIFIHINIYSGFRIETLAAPADPPNCCPVSALVQLALVRIIHNLLVNGRPEMISVPSSAPDRF